jgi:hypothetical protein
MIEFTYEFDKNGVWVHKLDIDDVSHTHYDNPKNAAEVCYLLLTGINLALINNEEYKTESICISGDQDKLLELVKNYKRNESDSLFESVFYEEVMLFHLLNQGGE